MTEIRIHDVVKVKSTNKISRIIDIHYAFDRYQIKGVSGWQYGIKDLEKLDTDSLIATIESLQKERDEADSNRNETIKNFNEIKNEYFANKRLIESQKEEIEKLNKENNFLKNNGNVHYVIKLKGKDQYFSKRGGSKNYSGDINKAIKFSSLESAQFECMGDERIITIPIQEGESK